MAASDDIFDSAPFPKTELRIVLIGGRLHGNRSGKSSAGNIILGQKVFDNNQRTAHSEAGQQNVFGRQLTVVDTPGWGWQSEKQDTPKLDQIEIEKSIHLCYPGPHVFLLVIPVGLDLPQIVKLSLKEHLELFNEDVFSFTIVLFTTVAPCSNETIESNIRKSPTLQWILHQCGNRHHVLNINRENRDQVEMLLKKIETMVTNNKGRYCSANRSQGRTLKGRIRALAERASMRFDQVQKQREKIKSHMKDENVLSNHFRIVMIGSSWVGKSSAGNTILGRKQFDVTKSYERTRNSNISHSVFEGRHLSVVDTPGWFYIHTLQDTNAMDKLEIENSVNFFHPGPNAVLLVIDLVTAMNVSCLRAVQEHMGLFREDIWEHTLALFTFGDCLGVKTVEERIESEEGLQWIVNKCGNRYHVLDNKDDSNKTQVTELIEKIEEMWAGKEDLYYEVDQDRAAQIEAEKEAGDKMAIRLKKIKERQSRVLKEIFEAETQPVTEINIILVGQKCSGKSEAGNIILQNEMFDNVFNTAFLKKIYPYQKATSTCVKHNGEVDGVKVCVVETPGWFTEPTPPDWIKDEIVHGVSLCPPGPLVFLLVVPVFRSFREEDLKVLLEILTPLKERVWRRCMVLFTRGDWLNDLPVESYIISEGKELQELLEKCWNRYHVINPYISVDLLQNKELFQKVIETVGQNKECFTTKEKKIPFLLTRKQMEKEWKQREDELIARMLKGLAKEPEEPTLPFEKTARSMDDFLIPDLRGDMGLEFAGASEWSINARHDSIKRFLLERDESDSSSGTGSCCSYAFK